MKISQVSIQRPVLALVLSMLILLAGMLGYSKLSIREYPKIERPVISLVTTYSGASAQVIESEVTQILEDALSGIDGVDFMSSTSRAGRSQITIQLSINKDPDEATADIRDKVAGVRRALPADAQGPDISKADADASPMMFISLASNGQLTRSDLSDIIKQMVKPRLQVVNGVAQTRIYGEQNSAIFIRPDLLRMASTGVSVADIEDAVKRQSDDFPAGRIEGNNRELNLVSNSKLASAETFAAIKLRTKQNSAIKLSDIASVEQSVKTSRVNVRLNGQAVVGLGIIRQATANPLEIAQEVYRLLPRIEAELPQGVSLKIASDSTIFITQSINAVYRTAIEAVLLVCLVIFVFLRRFRAAIIPIVTIPLSFIGAFALMSVLGFSINTLTLLALILSIGLVVDDAIVVLENTYRHIELGAPPIQAAFTSMREISFAVLVMTLTLAAVFTPMALSSGLTGKLFVEFALTLVAAVLVSGLIALTLSPMLCSRLLTASKRKQAKATKLSHYYGQFLETLLGERWVVVILMVFIAVLIPWLYQMSKKEMAPSEDRGAINIVVQGPEGATPAYMLKNILLVEEITKTFPSVNATYSLAGIPQANQGYMFLRLNDWNTRQQSSAALARSLNPKLSTVSGINAFAITPAGLGGGRTQNPIEFVITSNNSYDQLIAQGFALLEQLTKIQGLVNPDISVKLNTPEIRVEFDRERAAALQVSISDIGLALEALIGGRNITTYERAGNLENVVLQLDPELRKTPSVFNQIYVRNQQGAMLPLTSLVKLNENVAPRDLTHYNQRRSISFNAALAPTISQANALGQIRELAASQLPNGYSLYLTGQSRDFEESSRSLLWNFVLAIIFIYLVLAAQFESFRDPLIILLTVPLSVVGALGIIGLKSETLSLNIYSQIGLITLVGLVTKNGILIVEYANQLRDQGLTLTRAIVQASSIRLRPILMTSLATVLGALPLALASGPGAESRTQIGWIVVSGVTLGTFLSLFCIPVMYTFIARRQRQEIVQPSPSA